MSFKFDLNADISDTSWVDAIKVAPAEFVRIFGGPHRYLDACKVSGLYSFIDGEKVFTVYDWKSTSLWGDDLPSPLAFWNSRRQEELSIGVIVRMLPSSDHGCFIYWRRGKKNAASPGV